MQACVGPSNYVLLVFWCAHLVIGKNRKTVFNIGSRVYNVKI